MQEKVERWAILQGIYNAIGDELRVGYADNLRGEVTNFYYDLYERTGATGFEVRIGGQKVGTFGFSRVKGRPERTVTELRVTDMDALRGWESDEFNDFVARWVNDNLVELAVQYAAKTGELPDGVEYVTETIPATPETVKPNGVQRIKPEKVAAALGNALPATIAGLLEGGR